MARLRSMSLAGICSAGLLCSCTAQAQVPVSSNQARVPADRHVAKWVKSRSLKGGEGLAGTVVGVGKRQVWAFTSRLSDGDLRPSAYRWNGRDWRKFALPAGIRGMVMLAAARSSSEVWAAVDGDGENNGDRLLLRWNGARWSVARKLSGSPVGLSVWGRANVRLAVSGSATVVWDLKKHRWSRASVRRETFIRTVVTRAGGTWVLSARGAGAIRVLRSAGGKWRVVPLGAALPRPRACAETQGPYPCGEAILEDLSAPSSTTVWAVGTETVQNDAASSTERSFLLHGGTGAWTPSSVPVGFRIDKIVSDGGKGLWTVGHDGKGRVSAMHVTATGTWGVPHVLPTADAAVGSLSNGFTRAPDGRLWLAVKTTRQTSSSVWSLKP